MGPCDWQLSPAPDWVPGTGVLKLQNKDKTLKINAMHHLNSQSYNNFVFQDVGHWLHLPDDVTLVWKYLSGQD